MTDWPLPADPPAPQSGLPQPELPPIGNAAEPYPFWGYKDLGFFLVITFVGVLVGTAVAAGLIFLFGASSLLPLLLGQFVTYAAGIAALYLVISVRHRRAFWEGLHWPYHGGFAKWAAAGVATAIAGSLLAVAIGAQDIGDVPMMELMSSRMAVAVVGVLAVTIGPLWEELTFRGFLLPLLARNMAAIPAILITAILFALMHGSQYGWAWQALVPLAFAGTCFGAVRIYTGSTGAAAAMHAVYNLTVFFGFLATGGLKDLP